VALHDQGKFDLAAEKYKQVLAENPWEVTALHELAFTYFEGKKYNEALATGRLAAQCKSKILPRIYILIGNSLDELGDRRAALDTYKAALKLEPRSGLLHYNLGITEWRDGKKFEAKKSVEKAILLDPRHASSHALLASIYSDMGYRVPAILAYSRFLALEPQTRRATSALPRLEKLLTGGVTKGDKENHINIVVSMPPKANRDEGDFTSVEMMLSIVLAGDLITLPADAGKKPSNGFEKLTSLYASLGEALDNTKIKGGFAARYYAPHMAALVKAGHAKALVAQAWKGGTVEGLAEWAATNEAKLQALETWSGEYPWPAK
jgi:tetratricopeptide (TPR) repeat protein